jgi:cyclase
MAANTETAPAAAELHEVAHGVFAWVQPDGTWWINNAGAVTAGDGSEAVVVDTCATYERTTRFLAAVSGATGDAPITVAVNTHQHGDHTYGNSVLPAQTVLVGQRLMRAGLLADTLIEGCPPLWEPVPDWGPVTKRVPSIAVDERLTIHAGDRAIEVAHPGYPAHTTGDLVAWVPDARVLFAGDLLFHGLTPLVFMGSVAGARRALEWLASFQPDVVVPGHGPLAEAPSLPAVLDDHDRYYRFIEAVAAEGMAAGATPLEAARGCDLGEFAAWADSERLVLNLHRAYADAAGTDVDIIAAMLDAVTYNGGPLTTHVCGDESGAATTSNTS